MWMGRVLAFKSAACAAIALSITAHVYAGGVAAEALAAGATAATAAELAAAAASTRLPILLGLLSIGSGLAARMVPSRVVTRLVLEREVGGAAAGGAAAGGAAAGEVPAGEAAAGSAAAQPAQGTSAQGASTSPPPPALGFAPSPSGVQPVSALHASDADAFVSIHRPRLWSSADAVVRVRRHEISCAPSSALVQGFLLRTSASGRSQPQWLFPLPGAARSEDWRYLKELLFGDFFRREPPPPPDAALLGAIAGFGPYRPAQFADPRHPRYLPRSSPLLTEGPSGAFLSTAFPGTPFFAREGGVWAAFHLPPPPSLAQRREAEREAALYGRGGGARAAGALPRTAAPLTLMLDGSHWENRVRPGQEPQIEEAQAVGGRAEGQVKEEASQAEVAGAQDGAAQSSGAGGRAGERQQLQQRS